ncbi:MAG: ComEC/Rec2 family competence protein [Patescibacteria group bacterium]
MIYSFTFSFILGIIFENFFHFGWSVGVLIFIVSIILSLRLRVWLFFVIGTALFFGILRISLVDVSPDQNFTKFVGQKIYFEAIISHEPDVRDASASYTVNPAGSKSSMLLVADRFPEFKYGDKIKVFGKLDLPKNFESDNGTEFDYISYLSKDKIHFLIYRPEIKKLEGYGGNKFVASLYSLKNILIKNISAVVPEPNSSLLDGVIFGTKQSLGQDLLDDFKKVGLIHIVVLSGYNITIIAVGIFWALSFFGKRNLSFILSLIFILLFATMVGWGATVVRAVIMSLISILALYLGRPSDALRWLFIAGLLMLAWNPLILFHDPSFQLSFMATLGLILFSEIIDKKIISKIIKFLIKVGVPVSFIVALEKIKMREIISSTLAVQFFVLPLLIKMSGFVSLISFLINPIVLPLVPWAMGFGALTGAIGLLPFVGTILSWPFGIISYFISQIIISLTEFSSSLPLATLQTGSISFWLIFIWYLFYGFIFYKLKTSPRPNKFGLPLL